MFDRQLILMVMPERLGDVLMCTPAIHYLKHHHPSAQIDVIALSELSAQTLRYNRDIRHCWLLPSERWLTQRHYDIAINLHDGPLARRYLSLLKIPTYHISPPDYQQHQAKQALLFIQQLVQQSSPIKPYTYQLPISPHDRHTIQTLLKKNHIHPALDKLIICQIGCHSIAKRGLKRWRNPQHPKIWPAEYIVALGKQLQTIDSHLRLVLVGSRGETRLAKKLHPAIPGCINFVDQTSVTQLKALIDCAKVVVCPDSGIMHVTCSSQTPLIALFAPTQLKRTGPYPQHRPQTKIIQALCMEDIKVEKVLRAILSFVPIQPEILHHKISLTL